MKEVNLFNRRNFVKLSSIGALSAIPLISSANNLLLNDDPKFNPLKIFVFSKPLQFLGYEEMSKVVKQMGFDGVDLTVRPKGHVLPENVETDLLKATKAMKEEGLLTGMLSTSVIDPANPLDVNVLKVAHKLGYSLYRTGWIKYDKKRLVEESLPLYKKQLKDLAKLNEEIGITGGFQNHSGKYLGAPIWDLKLALEGLDKQNLGVQYDIMHATVEGGQSWTLGLDYIKDQINSLVIKDFKWINKKGKWKRTYVPLGEGMVDFDAYFKFLVDNKIDLPISLHLEYYLGGAEKGKQPTIDKEVIFEKMKKDLDFIRRHWAKANSH